jgi:hypothetical protein
VPFSLLTLDLPPAPLFKDEQEKNIIPQVRDICTATHTATLLARDVMSSA